MDTQRLLEIIVASAHCGTKIAVLREPQSSLQSFLVVNPWRAPKTPRVTILNTHACILKQSGTLGGFERY